MICRRCQVARFLEEEPGSPVRALAGMWHRRCDGHGCECGHQQLPRAEHRHLRTVDYHKAGTAYERFNRAVAVRVTDLVGSMTCAYLFCLIALAGLPQAVQQSLAGGRFSPLPLVQWTAQTFLQLVLLSVILVGQNVSAQASDARNSRQFEDAELLVRDSGQIKDALARIETRLAGEQEE